MDFHLTREQELVRQMMHDFTENEVKPIAAETDKTSTYPRENIEKLFDLGVMGMVVPEEFGGAGADDLSSAIAIEELSKQCASTGDILATHNGLSGHNENRGQAHTGPIFIDLGAKRNGK